MVLFNTEKNMKNKFAFFIATLGIGSWLKMAATTSGIIYMPLVWFLVYVAHNNGNFGYVIYLITLVSVLLFGLWSIPITEKILGSKLDPGGKLRERDQNQIVIDELFGMIISCIPFLFFVNISWWYFILTFCFFRFFDIFKSLAPGARYFDNIKNAWGVMLDDAVAGIYAGIVVYLISFLFII
jgi:phosphatidylglycerophosphatase A